jgi:sarcosine oxidase
VKTYDVIVVGVGGIGSAIALHAARRKLRVLGIEQYSLPNRRGSSHGITRILRVGLNEGPTYVPLVRRALDLWGELSAEIGTPLFVNNGSLDLAEPSSPVFQGSKAACEKFGLRHEILDPAAIRRRFPGVRPDPEMLAVFQPDSGLVLCEAATEAHLRLALAASAELHGHERMLAWERRGELYSVTTDRGAYACRSLVISAGAWAGRMLSPFGISIKAERQVMGWFQPERNEDHFSPARMPSWIIDSRPLGHFYGLPICGIPGFKLAKFVFGDIVNPSEAVLEPQRGDEEILRAFLRRYFPDADGPVMSLVASFFENTPDRNFIIDELPGHPNLWLAVGFSGHGFKYASAIGELMADLVTAQPPRYDLSSFRASRFSAPA